ncbi:uncharacterized protein GGS25DRAFT_78905 [Hypoxylon fragiforme]|uniref:uncharacterized protein n=1 Tax=Hypoxylon fragiforme TaxID=63214 RepID=UPI0020C5E0BE|nr:uncharacterized protein GGS25DRAFT_78905 [Hypoxylon fragiforme]KAI2603057.1 hypothetical protein GGS25DRAFT_78905 [Hypoxylon fragiforme]
MRKVEPSEDDELGILEDKTEALPLRSKRTERALKKQAKKTKKIGEQSQDLMNLPYELVLQILTLLRPSDLFNLQRVSKAYHGFIVQDGPWIAKSIMNWRYACLKKCFRLPVLMEKVDPSIQAFIQSPERLDLHIVHQKPYKHVQAPDPAEICTCLTCLLRWLSLCLIVDFSHWQKNLDMGEPIPMIRRGKNPEWNRNLIASNAAIVRKALHSPLWYARLLEAHLSSTVRSISRHAANKGNKRHRFRMSRREMESGADLFLERSGPPSFDFPFHRDNYYMLEAYLPNRGWNAEHEKWMYVPANQHNLDIDYIASRGRIRRKRAAEETERQPEEGQRT